MRWLIRHPAAWLLAVLLLLAPELAVAALSPRAHQALGEAQALLQGGKYDQADAALGKALDTFGSEPAAQALAWQLRAYLFSQTGREAEAVRLYEQALASGALDGAATQQVRFNSAMLLMGLGRHREATERTDAWLAGIETPDAEQRVQAGWVYLGAKSYQHAVRQFTEALRARPAAPEGWYQMLLVALQGAEDHQGLKVWLPQVIDRFPGEKRYWQQLSSTYFHLKDDRRALATLAAAYHNGLLTESAELLHLARFYLYAGVPHKAARVLQQGLDRQILAASASHYELLADSWLQAQEIPLATAAYERALQAGAAAETSLKLGQLLLRREGYGAARTHLQRATQSSQERTRAEALLLLGMATYFDGDAIVAQQIFQQALAHPPVRRQAQNWLAFLDGAASGGR